MSKVLIGNIKGPSGAPGEGVPTGGTAGQVLAKASGADYDTEWVSSDATPTSGSANPITSGGVYLALAGKADTESSFLPWEYEGVDLEEKFAAEIADYDSVWDWLKARLTAKNVSGIHIKDYITWTSTDGKVVKSQVAGINQYLLFNDQTVTAWHIDFVSKDLWPEQHVWNKVNFNNGIDAEHPYPYLCSDLKLWLNGESGAVPNATTVNPTTVAVDYRSDGVLPRLPEALKNVIVNKRTLLSQRYSSSGVLTDDNSWGWADLGKLWVPSEMEVYGCCVWGTKGWSQSAFTQYPIFRDSKMRIKGLGNNGSRYHWWLLTPYSGNSAHAALVNANGYANSSGTSDTWVGAPVCFRIAG